MRVGGKAWRSLTLGADRRSVEIIDQTVLPHSFRTLNLSTLAQVLEAIQTMQVRGAPLIGVAAAYGVCLAMRADDSDDSLLRCCEQLLATRPTAVNLRWALERMKATLGPLTPSDRESAGFAEASAIAEEEVEISRRIAEHGAALITQAWLRGGKQRRVSVLTHCNAGWLATIDWGTALAPVYLAHDGGTPVHVWVDETRPRNQGYLTSWELLNHGVPHTVVVDNAGGHLMQQGEVDLCIVGTDRTTSTGDVCNKIGTYLKALAAQDNQVPFYVAVPGSSIDWSLQSGSQIPIEERAGLEIHKLVGVGADGNPSTVRVTPAGAQVANFGFDVTPARLVSGLITERGLCRASAEGLRGLYPERG